MSAGALASLREGLQFACRAAPHLSTDAAAGELAAAAVDVAQVNAPDGRWWAVFATVPQGGELAGVHQVARARSRPHALASAERLSALLRGDRRALVEALTPEVRR